MRLDKYLAHCSLGTRSEVKKILKKGVIKVNSVVKKDGSIKINLDKDIVEYHDEVITYREFIYLMLHKPAGVVSATIDNQFTTVVDLVREHTNREIFPLGRLDIDTEGLLILSDNGKLAHNLLSPKYHVEKTYYVRLENKLNVNDIVSFKEGLCILDGKNNKYLTKPAILEIKNDYEAYVTISEGKFHQIKRMFQSINNKVNYLKRIEFGGIKLDKDLETGKYRELTEYEVDKLLEQGRMK